MADHRYKVPIARFVRVIVVVTRSMCYIRFDIENDENMRGRTIDNPAATHTDIAEYLFNF